MEDLRASHRLMASTRTPSTVPTAGTYRTEPAKTAAPPAPATQPIATGVDPLTAHNLLMQSRDEAQQQGKLAEDGSLSESAVGRQARKFGLSASKFAELAGWRRESFRQDGKKRAKYSPPVDIDRTPAEQWSDRP